MDGDPGSLSNLRDLAIPPAVPYWPPAPGVWIIAGGIAGIVVLLLWRAARKYRADAYRRAALAELDRIAVDASADGSTAERIFAVLKRTALATYGRDAVAPLTGPAWADFITQTAGPRFEAGSFARLQAQAYGNDGAPQARDLEKLFAEARVWIRSHRAFADAGSE